MQPAVGGALPQPAAGPIACHFVTSKPRKVKKAKVAPAAPADAAPDAAPDAEEGGGGAIPEAEDPALLTPVRNRIVKNKERWIDESGNLRPGAHHQRKEPDLRYNCRVCGEKTSYYCSTHSDRAARSIIWVCISRRCHHVHAQAELDAALRVGRPMNAAL